MTHLKKWNHFLASERSRSEVNDHLLRNCNTPGSIALFVWLIAIKKNPTCDFEKDELVEAGLGEKEVEFGSYDMGFTEIKEVLCEEFLRLREGGGFQLLKCAANSRVLEPLSKTVYTSLKILRQRVGQGRTYIHSLQHNLNLTPIFKITDAVSDVLYYTIK